jgi:hypothetical protein
MMLRFTAFPRLESGSRLPCSPLSWRKESFKRLVDDNRKPALCQRRKEKASGDFLQDADRPRMLARGGFYCFCGRFLARIFGHQLPQLMFDSNSRRKLELSSKMMRAHWALLP